MIMVKGFIIDNLFDVVGSFYTTTHSLFSTLYSIILCWGLKNINLFKILINFMSAKRSSFFTVTLSQPHLYYLFFFIILHLHFFLFFKNCYKFFTFRIFYFTPFWFFSSHHLPTSAIPSSSFFAFFCFNCFFSPLFALDFLSLSPFIYILRHHFLFRFCLPWLNNFKYLVLSIRKISVWYIEVKTIIRILSEYLKESTGVYFFCQCNIRLLK
jgi:hypothetical protein